MNKRLAAVLLVCALGLPGCGPGVGGSGTGEDLHALQTFGAEPSAVCASELAPVLACGGTPATAAGTGAVAFTADSVSGTVALQLQGNEATFTVGCTVLRFSGRWGQAGGTPPRLYGVLDRGDGAPRVAQLELRRVENRIEATLRDVEGQALFGPVLLAPGTVPSCP